MSDKSDITKNEVIVQYIMQENVACGCDHLVLQGILLSHEKTECKHKPREEFKPYVQLQWNISSFQNGREPTAKRCCFRMLWVLTIYKHFLYLLLLSLSF